MISVRSALHRLCGLLLQKRESIMKTSNATLAGFVLSLGLGVGIGTAVSYAQQGPAAQTGVPCATGGGPQQGMMGGNMGYGPMQGGMRQGMMGGNMGYGPMQGGMRQGMMGGNMGYGPMQGGMRQGMMGGNMGYGMMQGGRQQGMAGPNSAIQQLMTPEERSALVEKMRNAKTPDERQKLATENRAEMEKRAKEKGITLPPARGPHFWFNQDPG